MTNTFRWSETMQGLASMYLTLDLCKGLQFKTSNGLNVRFALLIIMQIRTLRKTSKPCYLFQCTLY